MVKYYIISFNLYGNLYGKIFVAQIQKAATRGTLKRRIGTGVQKAISIFTTQNTDPFQFLDKIVQRDFVPQRFIIS